MGFFTRQPVDEKYEPITWPLNDRGQLKEHALGCVVVERPREEGPTKPGHVFEIVEDGAPIRFGVLAVLSEHAVLQRLKKSPSSVEADRESAEQQIDRLANYILANVPGEPSCNEGAVDTAIRLLGRWLGKGANVDEVQQALGDMRPTNDHPLPSPLPHVDLSSTRTAAGCSRADCCLEAGHEGPHAFKCAGKFCPGLRWKASNTPHPSSCAIDFSARKGEAP